MFLGGGDENLGLDADPVAVAAELVGQVSLAPGGQPHLTVEDDEMRATIRSITGAEVVRYFFLGDWMERPNIFQKRR